MPVQNAGRMRGVINEGNCQKYLSVGLPTPRRTPRRSRLDVPGADAISRIGRSSPVGARHTVPFAAQSTDASRAYRQARSFDEKAGAVNLKSCVQGHGPLIHPGSSTCRAPTERISCDRREVIQRYDCSARAELTCIETSRATRTARYSWPVTASPEPSECASGCSGVIPW